MAICLVGVEFAVALRGHLLATGCCGGWWLNRGGLRQMVPNVAASQQQFLPEAFTDARDDSLLTALQASLIEIESIY
jgi:hypothetical protein